MTSACDQNGSLEIIKREIKKYKTDMESATFGASKTTVDNAVLIVVDTWKFTKRNVSTLSWEINIAESTSGDVYIH